ncbi:MAG: FtsQ-type POTRA domain-containing protein [Clostridia bacterium]|nr:FtsQ-type POTRA domain-containing protein [Clostridia bacterium]
MNGGKGSDFEFKDGKIIRRDNGEEKNVQTVSSDTESRRMLESFRESRARKTAIRRTAAVCMILAAVIILAAVFVFIFFRINDVTVTGSQKYTEQELYSALKLSKTSNLFLTKTSALEDRLRKAYPSLDEISIKKQLPDKLIITVTDGVGEYYIKMGGQYYSVTSSLKIIEITDEKPDIKVELLSCDISKAVLGEKIEFRTETHYNYLCKLLTDVKEHSISPHINRIDMSEKFDVSLKYDDRFIINIGAAEQTKTKLTLSESIISTLSAEETGIIDATSTEKCSYRKTNEIK